MIFLGNIILLTIDYSPVASVFFHLKLSVFVFSGNYNIIHLTYRNTNKILYRPHQYQYFCMKVSILHALLYYNSFKIQIYLIIERFRNEKNKTMKEEQEVTVRLLFE